MLLAEKYLGIVNKRGKEGKELKRVYRNMRKEGLFLRAYSRLYANQGATTVGSDPTDTIQGMSVARIRSIIQELGDGTFEWKPARRKYVPKANGDKRPIAVPNWKEKLVQEVMRMILEAYYEPSFSERSHGFRPNRGCHTALEAIRYRWTGTKWFIEGDIKGCFDNIPHSTILSILERNIKDNRFLKLVKGMLEAGYMEDWQYHQTYSGTPQGGVISPLLANIVLNELDKFVEDTLIPEYTRGKRKAVNPEYRRLGNKSYAAKRRKDWDAYKDLKRKMQSMPSRDPNDPNFRRLRYVRYADDFVLGFIGPKSEARDIKARIGEYLQTLGLSMSDEKTLITNARSGRAKFLGYEIRVAWNDTAYTGKAGRGSGRMLNGKIQLHVPKAVVQKWVSKYSQNGKPYYRPPLMVLSDYEIVMAYGTQLRGLAHYYLMAMNVDALARVYYVANTSLRRTLMAKHKLTTKQSYKRYWHESKNTSAEWSHMRVVVEREGKKPLIAKSGEVPLRTEKRKSFIGDVIPAKYGVLEQRSELVSRLLAEKCEVCGKPGPVEAHHVRKLADLKRTWKHRKEKPIWVKNMISRRRKTIFVCRSCHMDITHGRHDGIKLR